MTTAADRHLLFGLLALQTGLVRQDQLVAAFHAWTTDKSRPIDDHLIALGFFNEAQKAPIEALVSLHAAAHDGDVEQGLHSIGVGQSTREKLQSLADPDLGASLASVGQSESDPDRTGTYHYRVGSTTSQGQRFRVLRPHARGGLGAVFVALDSELNREVALKQILDHHADDPQLRGRFLVEAEITGGLEHPGIVPVYGLGTYGDGRPYYAMRFIRGDSLRESIDAYHKRRKSVSERSLEFRRLLRKFTDVCNAIEYAHSRGVLHRDVKPGNVIVGKHGETLVVDWGLAKALGKSAPDAAERTLVPSSGDGSSETLPGQALGTPAYMSPEQARGDLEKLGPRSDVYSLGATLYYLLTGKAPFQGEVEAILKAVEAGDFPRPRERDAAIDPALEAIVLKAMANDPTDRYGSAQALAEEVDRWLADERVEAYPEPWTRSLNRWLSRHRTGVTGIAAAGVVALIGLGAVSVVQTRANDDLKASNVLLGVQRKRAEANEAEAIDAVKRFKDVIADNPELKNNPELKALRATLLKEPLAFFGKLRERLQADHDSRPESLNKLAHVTYAHAALIYEIGDKSDAIQAFQEYFRISDRLADDHPTVTNYQANRAGGHANLGNVLSDMGRSAEARMAYQQAITIGERLARDHPAVAEYQSQLATSYNSLGNLLRATGPADEARAAFEQAIAIQGRLVREHPVVRQYPHELARSYSNLRLLLHAAGRHEESRATYQQAIDMEERLVRDHPTVTEFQASLANCFNSLAALLRGSGHHEEAQAANERALSIRERLAHDHPTVTDFQANLAVSHNSLGVLLLDAGHSAKARAAFEQAVVIGERLARDHPTDTEFQANLANGHNSLGVLLRDLDCPDEAESALKRAIDVAEKLVQDHPAHIEYQDLLALSHNNLGLLMHDMGRLEGAQAAYVRALAIRERLARDHPTATEYQAALAAR